MREDRGIWESNDCDDAYGVVCKVAAIKQDDVDTSSTTAKSATHGTEDTSTTETTQETTTQNDYFIQTSLVTNMNQTNMIKNQAKDVSIVVISLLFILILILVIALVTVFFRSKLKSLSWCLNPLHGRKSTKTELSNLEESSML